VCKACIITHIVGYIYFTHLYVFLFFYSYLDNDTPNTYPPLYNEYRNNIRKSASWRSWLCDERLPKDHRRITEESSKYKYQKKPKSRKYQNSKLFCIFAKK